MNEVLVTIAVFGGIYLIIKVFTDFLLKRKLINAGHVDKAGILEPAKSLEENTYPTLKWGLVTLFAGLGLLIIAFLHNGVPMDYMNERTAFLQFGIELVAISAGFLFYFILMRTMKK